MFLGNPRVLVIPYSEGKDVMPQGRGVQYEAIYHFLRNYKDRHTWALHIDVDEFVYLKRHKSEGVVIGHGLVSNHWDCWWRGRPLELWEVGMQCKLRCLPASPPPLHGHPPPHLP
jgi:hypothetical protein